MVDSRGIATDRRTGAASAHGVIEAQVQVRGSGTSPVQLRADVGVYPGADVKRAGSETRQTVRDAVDRLVGLKVSDVTVAVHVLETDELTRLLE